MQTDELLNKIHASPRFNKDDWSIIFGNGDDFFYEPLVDGIAKYFRGVEKNLVCFIKTSYSTNFIMPLLSKMLGKIWEIETKEIGDENNKDDNLFIHLVVLRLRNPNFWEPPIRIRLIFYTFALLRYFSKPYSVQSMAFHKYGERAIMEQLSDPSRFLVAAAEIVNNGEYYLNKGLYDFIHTYFSNIIDRRPYDYLPIKTDYPECVYSYLSKIISILQAKNYLKNALRKVIEFDISQMSDILSQEYDNMKREF